MEGTGSFHYALRIIIASSSSHNPIARTPFDDDLDTYIGWEIDGVSRATRNLPYQNGSQTFDERFVVKAASPSSTLHLKLITQGMRYRHFTPITTTRIVGKHSIDVGDLENHGHAEPVLLNLYDPTTSPSRITGTLLVHLSPITHRLEAISESDAAEVVTQLQPYIQRLLDNEQATVQGNVNQAVLIADQLQRFLDHSAICTERDETLIQRTRRMLHTLAKQSGILPRSIVLQPEAVALSEKDKNVKESRFSNVSLGLYDQRKVALKTLRVTLKPEQQKASFLFRADLSTSFNIRHKHILPFHGITEQLVLQAEVPRLTTVLAWMDNGTILEYLDDPEHHPPQVERLVSEIAEGLEYLHSQNVIHGDLKPSNVFIDAETHVRLADFALSPFTTTTTNPSTRFHAPELLLGTPTNTIKRTRAMDVYAFGVLLYEIYSLRNEEDSGRDRPSTAECRSPLTDSRWNLLEWCWAFNPTHRPSMQEVLAEMRNENL